MAEGSNILTKKVAERFLKLPNSTDLSPYTHLEGGALDILAKAQTSLFLSGLCTVSDDDLRTLVRLPSKLSLGLTELSDLQAQILELYQGSYLGLDSLTELSDAAAESLGRLTLGGICGSLSLKKVRRFSPVAAEHLSKKDKHLTLPGRLELTQEAFKELFSGNSLCEVHLDGEIILPDYGYELVRTDALANSKWMDTYSASRWREKLEEYQGGGRRMDQWRAENVNMVEVPVRMLTTAGAAILRFYDPLRLKLQSLPDEVAAALSEHNGFLSIQTEDQPSVATLGFLARRKYLAKPPAGQGDIKYHRLGLELGITELNPDGAACLAETAYPLYFPRLRSLSVEAATALARHRGELFFASRAQHCVRPRERPWPCFLKTDNEHYKKHLPSEIKYDSLAHYMAALEEVAAEHRRDARSAIQALSTKEGPIDGEPSSKWAKKWLKACS